MANAARVDCQTKTVETRPLTAAEESDRKSRGAAEDEWNVKVAERREALADKPDDETMTARELRDAGLIPRPKERS